MRGRLASIPYRGWPGWARAASSHHILEFNRDQLTGIREPQRSDEPFPGPGPTGTRVVLQEIHRDWFEGVTAASVQAEIERHFERLLARPNLEVSVAEAGEPPLLCRPFDYTAQAGVLLERTLEVCDGEEVFPVEVCLLAGQRPYPERRPVFTARGRRVAAFSTLRAFMRRAPGGAAVWNHPCLTGYVEAGELVEPVLNRDKFVRTRRRALLFDAQAALEPELRQALQAACPGPEIDPLAHLEALVQKALTGAAPAPVQIVAQLPEGVEARAAWQGNRLLINAGHPDFRARLGRSVKPAGRIGEGMAAYLAVLIASTPPAHSGPAAQQSAGELAGRIFDLTARLRKAAG